MKKALILVDVQYDFMPPVKVSQGDYPGTGTIGFGYSTIGGALAVPKGDEIIPVIEKLLIDPSYSSVVATQDWHPSDHCSFKANGGPWPLHCLQTSPGAMLHEKILRSDLIIIKKGVNKDVDSYSGFWDNERKHTTDLNAILRGMNIDEVHLAGLALDYCVMFTALDAVELGYKTYLIKDACRAVNINPDDGDKAIQKMQEKGVIVV